jgi:protein TonB
MRASPDDQLFSADEIARAAGVPVTRVVGLLGGGDAASTFAPQRTAIRLVQQLRRRGHAQDANRSPISLITETRRRQGLPLFLSGTLHTAFLLALLLITSGLLTAEDTEQQIVEPQPIRLVYFMTPGPGGGGGGGGMNVPLPPARIERKAPKAIRKVNSPVPPVRKAVAPKPVEPPTPAEPPKIEPPKIDPPKIEPPKPEPPRVEPPPPAPPQTVQAPVVAKPADQADRAGVLNQPPSSVASAGPGTGGGVGTGAGTGMGEGRGTGIGPGSGGGIGGGPFQPGAGIEPPSLVRDVKPLYTDDARKRSIEGDVVLEIVVRRDGSVGNMRVLRKLGAGLDERAMEAVRQWRFTPAKRQGASVDVFVEVSVAFKLR